ncbi:MAG TPA: HAD family hydrolase [Fimbriimonadaceae bacterium]|mgnify:CR=1 FL=1|nr:HAD family hydrolase [Fimbriimonadaceae bacterium]
MNCPPLPVRVRAVLFDVDGTLADSVPMIVAGLGDAFVQFAGVRPSAETLRGLIGMPLAAQMNLYGLDSSLTPLPERIAFTMDRFAFHADKSGFFDPAVEALRACHKAGLGTALVTSKNADELRGFLPKFPARGAVDVTVCASDVDRPKPAPDSARLACARLDVAPADAILIGDSIFDLQCARDAGVTPIAVAYGASTEETLAREHPAALISTPAALYEWVSEHLTTLHAT